jgi:hypothetical protein
MPKKNQTAISKKMYASVVLKFGIWSFFGAWSLGFGVFLIHGKI